MMKMRTTTWLALFAAATLSTACGGCTDEPEPGNNGDGEVDMGTPDEGMPDPDPDPDTGEPPVTNGPAWVEVQMSPGRDTYATGLRLLPEVQTFDAFGDPADYDYEVTVEPASAVMKVEDRYELVEEGIVRFTACTVEKGVDGEDVCGWDEVIVNNGPPSVEITSPAAGAQLDETADPVITVEGTVTDTFGEPVAFVNGVPVDLDDEGNFSTEVTPMFGVNHIEVAASDGLDAATTTKAVDVQWAADYVDPADPPVDFGDGVVLRLGQQFIDDRQRVTTLPDGTFQTQDLADILELVLRNFDLASQLPDPVVDSSSFYLRVTQLAVGKPFVQLDITDTGLEIFIQLPDIQAVTEGSLAFDQTMLDLDGTITAGMSALVIMDVDKPSANDPIEVTVDSLSVAVENASSNFASPEANAVFELAQSALRSTLEDLLVDTLQTTFVTELPSLLTNIFSTLDEVLADQSIDLDTGLGDPVTLNIDGGVRKVETYYRNNLSAALGLTASTDVSDVHADSRGYGRNWPMAMDTGFFEQGRIQIGLRFALINALLHTLWDAGLLEADVTEQVPVNVESALLSAKLPPIIRPPLRGEPHDFIIQLGQVELELEILGRTDRYGLLIETGIDFALADGALEVNIGDEPEIKTWLISSSEDEPFLAPEALRSLIAGQVWPEFTAALAGGLSLPLPAPDLSGLGNVAAPLADLMLEFKQLRPVAARDGWVIVDANLEGTLPVN